MLKSPLHPKEPLMQPIEEDKFTLPEPDKIFD